MYASLDAARPLTRLPADRREDRSTVGTGTSDQCAGGILSHGRSADSDLPGWRPRRRAGAAHAILRCQTVPFETVACACAALMPAISVVMYRLVRWMDMPVPEPELRIGPALLIFIAFFVGGSGEELNWSGYALDPMQARSGALGASLVLGRVGILWHLTPLLLMGRSLT